MLLSLSRQCSEGFLLEALNGKLGLGGHQNSIQPMAMGLQMEKEKGLFVYGVGSSHVIWTGMHKWQGVS